MRLKDWLNDVSEKFYAVSDRFKPTEYIDYHDTPDDPQSPYRARVSMTVDTVEGGVEVSEREIVRGDMQMVYAIRCPCGRRWFDTAPERLQVCPKCGKAVLLQPLD
jgi:transcription initiation factor IIE alpha subunit